MQYRHDIREGNELMNSTSRDARFVWIDDALVERLRLGVPLVIFGASNLFVDKNFKSKAISEQFAELRNKVPGIRITNLAKFDSLDPVEASGRFQKVANDIADRHPRVLFMGDAKEEVLSESCGALDGGTAIGRVLMANKVMSTVLSDTIQIDLANPVMTSPSREFPPMTPIEWSLHKAMEALGMNVNCQVNLDPYIADFVVSKGQNRFVVEADGAAFHDAEKDQVRDRNILERHGLETLRFSGSAIYADADKCANSVLSALVGRQQDNERKGQYPSEDLDILDRSQRAAVEHSGGDARILAPAGSGKTKVLVNRVIRLLNDGEAPTSILVLAFNKKAAVQLEERLGTLGVPVGKGRDNDVGVWIATLNSFGNRVLMNEGLTSKLLDKPWKEKELVKNAAAESGLHLVGLRGQDPMAILTREIARVRRGLRSPAELEIEVPQPGKPRMVAIDVLWEAVRDIQRRKSVMTFDDQIFLATDLMLREPMVRRTWQKRFRHVLVDEYQDLNESQVMLMRLLTAGSASIFAVGDDDQVIYSWRDASVVNLLENFKGAYPGMTDHVLEINYRCPKPIVRASQRLIKWNKRRHPKNIRPSDSAPEGAITLSKADEQRPMAVDLVSFFTGLHSEHKIDWQSMVVLTRTNVQLLSAAVALDNAGIPRGPLPNIQLYSKPVARRLLSYLQIVVKGPLFVHSKDLAEVVNRPNRFVKNQDVERLGNSQNAWLMLNLLAYGCPNSHRKNDELVKFIKDVREVSGMATNIQSLSVNIVNAVVQRFKFASNPDESTQSADEATDEVILHVLMEDARTHTNIEDFIDHMASSAREELGEEPDGAEKVHPEKEKDEQRDEVMLSTIHTAKGREWPVVCLYDVSREASDLKNTKTDEEEERRVFYVGMTRATRYLHFSYVAGKPDPFLAEALLPQEIVGKNVQEVAHWKDGKSKRLEQIRQEKSDTETGISSTENEISRLTSGEKVSSLEKRRDGLYRTRSSLQEHILSLSRERPVGMIVRLFKGGRSSEGIATEMRVLGDRLESLDHQIEAIGKDIYEASTETGRLLETARKRRTDLRSGLVRLNDTRREIQGELEDVELAWDHLPLVH
jgi:superfamily I DNA/RNA helicase/very-short-patch-repair endonuclease